MRTIYHISLHLSYFSISTRLPIMTISPTLFSRPAQALDGTAHGRCAHLFPVSLFPDLALFWKRRLPVRLQLTPQIGS